MNSYVNLLPITFLVKVPSDVQSPICCEFDLRDGDVQEFNSLIHMRPIINCNHPLDALKAGDSGNRKQGQPAIALQNLRRDMHGTVQKFGFQDREYVVLSGSKI